MTVATHGERIRVLEAKLRDSLAKDRAKPSRLTVVGDTAIVKPSGVSVGLAMAIGTMTGEDDTDLIMDRIAGFNLEVADEQDEPDYLSVEAGRLEVIREWAAWLGDTCYPFDFRTSILPPEEVRRAVEDWWVENDSDSEDPGECQAIRDNVADEGGWSK